MTKEFNDTELTARAFEVYSNSDFCFAENTDGTFNIYTGNIDKTNLTSENNTIDDVNSFLEEFAEVE